MKKSSRDQRSIAIIFGAAAVVILAVAVWAVVMFSKPTAEELLETGTFQEGIFIADVDVSGKTVKEAEPLIRAQADAMLSALSASYTVNGAQYTLDAYDLGAEIALEETLCEAMLYEKTKEEKDTGRYITFELAPAFSEERIHETLEILGAQYNTQPVDAAVTVVTDQSESALTCSGKVEYQESSVGMTVDADALAARIYKALTEGTEQMPLAVEPIITEPAVSSDQLQRNCTLMAKYKTTFETSAFGRCYNIWKMATVINGVVLQPGEQWSINEAAGDRTTANGWADAAGIKNGAYVDEPGGGICQVSTTLYNAILRSEVTVVERKHHSWPSNYVPVGLDATISTGAPDFVIKNPYDYPIAIVANVDGKNAKQITVSIYGPEMEYKLDFTSTVIKETEPEPAKTTFDPELTPGTSKQVSPRKVGKVVEVYKHWYDKESGKEIKDPELYYTDTYKAFTGTVAYGPSATPSPSATPAASASSAPAASASTSPAPTQPAATATQNSGAEE